MYQDPFLLLNLHFMHIYIILIHFLHFHYSSVKQGNLGHFFTCILLDLKNYTFTNFTYFTPSPKHTHNTFSYLKIIFKSNNAHKIALKYPLFILKIIFENNNLYKNHHTNPTQTFSLFLYLFNQINNHKGAFFHPYTS